MKQFAFILALLTAPLVWAQGIQTQKAAHLLADFGFNTLEQQSVAELGFFGPNDSHVQFRSGQNVLLGLTLSASHSTECGPLLLLRSEGEMAAGGMCHFQINRHSGMGPRSGFLLMGKTFWVFRDPKAPVYNDYVDESREAKEQANRGSDTWGTDSDMRQSFTQDALWLMTGAAWRYAWTDAVDVQVGLHFPPLVHLDRVRASHAQAVMATFSFAGSLSLGWNL